MLEPSLLSEIDNWSRLFKMSLKPNWLHAPLCYLQTGIFIKSIFIYLCTIFQVFTHIIHAISFWQLGNKTVDCFNEIVFLWKIGKQLNVGKGLGKVCNRNAELLWLVKATFDSKAASLKRIRRKIWSFWKVCRNKVRHFLFLIPDIWVVKYQLKVFEEL